jgi:tetratricopeptide (TPR) repeat protein
VQGNSHPSGKIDMEKNKLTEALNALETGSYNSAYDLLKSLADSGNAVALYYLAKMYQEGQGVAQDLNEAIFLYEKSAEKEFVTAYLQLAFIYYMDADFEDADFKKAFYWFNRAAIASNSEGQFWLGVLYKIGNGVGQDNGMALTWFRRSARQGNVQAQYKVAEMIYFHETSLGLTDDDQVLKWAKLAALKGHEGALDLLKELLKEKQKELSSPSKLLTDGIDPEHVSWIVGEIENAIADAEEIAGAEEEEPCKEETQNGLVTEFYESGGKKLETNFKDGIREGRRTSWYESGKKKSESTFRRGIINGPETCWYESGRLENYISFKNGKQDSETFFTGMDQVRRRASYIINMTN